jgi:hypothetical protein
MSVLNKLEVTYLNLLRGVLLVIASILVIVALLAGVKGLIGITGFGSGDVKPEKITPDQIINAVNEKPKADAAAPKAEAHEKKAEDAYNAQYEKIANTVIGFVAKYSNNTEKVGKNELIAYFAATTNAYPENVREAYINGLADTFEKALKDGSIIKRTIKVKGVIKAPAPVAPVHQTQEVTNEDGTVSTEEIATPAETLPVAQNNAFNESPSALVDAIALKYNEFFNASIAAAAEANAVKVAEKLESKASALMTLYIAGGAFFAFLWLIFMSIIVKIERNLRVISEKP